MKPCQIADDAEADLADALAFYREESESLAGRLHDELQKLIVEVATVPRRYRVIDPPIRRHFSELFPYAILYIDKPDRILIVAVAHFKRHPGYWRDRLT